MLRGRRRVTLRRRIPGLGGTARGSGSRSRSVGRPPTTCRPSGSNPSFRIRPGSWEESPVHLLAGYHRGACLRQRSHRGAQPPRAAPRAGGPAHEADQARGLLRREVPAVVRKWSDPDTPDCLEIYLLSHCWGWRSASGSGTLRASAASTGWAEKTPSPHPIPGPGRAKLNCSGSSPGVDETCLRRSGSLRSKCAKVGKLACKGGRERLRNLPSQAGSRKS